MLYEQNRRKVEPLLIISSVTRWSDCFFNIWPFTMMKFCPGHTKSPKQGFTTLPRIKQTFKMLPKICKYFVKLAKISPKLVTLIISTSSSDRIYVNIYLSLQKGPGVGVVLLSTSVTRFGKILPLWQKSKVFGLFIDGLFCHWQNFEPMYIYYF